MVVYQAAVRFERTSAQRVPRFPPSAAGKATLAPTDAKVNHVEPVVSTSHPSRLEDTRYHGSMPRFKTVVRRARFVSFGWNGPEMQQASDGLINRGILPRVRAGLTIDDNPAPPLNPKYAKRKAARGLVPIRDWTFSGRTLRSLKTISAALNRAVIWFTDTETRKRAFFNNRRARQFGVSNHDRAVLAEEFDKLPAPVRAVQID
jgi:hypothetical protein